MKPGDMARLEASVRGRVHGVGFRYYVVVRADRLGLTGWVANMQDGSIRCVAEGPRADLDYGRKRSIPPSIGTNVPVW
jgi:acylphosphatase